jgi:hypothetical protein
MKKSLLLLVVCIIYLQIAGFSQKTRAGIQAGVVLAKMTGQFNGNDNDYETKTGYTVGVIVDAPINSKFSFAPGLHFVQKGTLQRPPVGTLITKSYIALRYAELNLNFIYKAPGKRGNFFVGAGPSIGFNLPSKKGTQINKDKTETDVAFGVTIDKDLRGVDYGINTLLGYRLNKGLYVSLNLNLGMRDLRPVEASGVSDIKNRYFGIQVGWLLANKAN